MSFLVTTISKFLPTSSFDIGPGEDGVEASKLGLIEGRVGVRSEADELYSVSSFPSIVFPKLKLTA